mmetsp:Transcript_11433/g.29306  ORF Transcript_11433/g.29306 Transcript_11433/m.29306 type:complete len:202 (+) Transcript_11433:1060-1665(+)
MARSRPSSRARSRSGASRGFHASPSRLVSSSDLWPKKSPSRRPPTRRSAAGTTRRCRRAQGPMVGRPQPRRQRTQARRRSSRDAMALQAWRTGMCALQREHATVARGARARSALPPLRAHRLACAMAGRRFRVVSRGAVALADSSPDSLVPMTHRVSPRVICVTRPCMSLPILYRRLQCPACDCGRARLFEKADIQRHCKI